jgi:hypothetical protein
VLHAVDYKTNRRPPTVEDVRGDIQLKIQHLVTAANAGVFGLREPRVVMHLDAVKWREIEVSYTDTEIEDLRTWLIAVVRTILRDEEGAPQLNPGCGWCPVRHDCPAFASLPEVAVAANGVLPLLDTDEAKLAWRTRANKMRLLLEKAVKDIDDGFERRARADGELVVGDTKWEVETEWTTQVDLRALHAVMDDAFYDVVATSKTKIEKAVAEWPASLLGAVRGCYSSVATGTKVVRRKVTGRG